MLLHAQGVLPGLVPITWLQEHGLFICPNCLSLVATSHTNSHQKKCTHSFEPSIVPTSDAIAISDGRWELPTFEEICKLQCRTLHHIPASAKPAFAAVLSSALRSVLYDNTEESWIKLFMLPKCILSSSKRRGRHHKPTSIKYLCELWSNENFEVLWQHAFGQSSSKPFSQCYDHAKVVCKAISLAREGLFGKACQVLTSSGVAPNNETTWKLLQAKHPEGPLPMLPPVHTLAGAILPPDFNVLTILKSFSKATACGPSGLCIQHLLNAAEVPLPSPIGALLRDVVNLLASGKVPVSVSKFLAGGSLTALDKNKPNSLPDICPITVGEALRRLVGKCLCAVTKEKASEYFAPLQMGVACPSGAEKIIHGLMHCVEEHWMDEDIAVMKIDMRNAFNLVSCQALLDECSAHFPELLPWAS